MDYFIYRNFTVENLFREYSCSYSGYGDISEIPENAKNYIWFYLPSLRMNKEELNSEIASYEDKFNFLFSQLPPGKTVIAFTLISTLTNKFENSNFETELCIAEFNKNLIQLEKSNSNLKVIDFSNFIEYCDASILDWKHYYISQSIINIRLNQKFSKWFGSKIDSIHAKRKKCIVLDLDNTLWGGIIGEDGIEGIQIGDTYPGIAYRDFQENLLEASKNGIILTVCSKNNLEDVTEVWNKHPFQLIKEHHLSAYRINWQDKATNIQEIAEELNIGLDSIVFIDDNPVERERVSQMLPEIIVPDFPTNPYMLSSFFFEIYENNFQVYRLTKEDKNKTEQYISNTQRNIFKKNFRTVDEYLESLEMEIVVYPADAITIPRIVQITNKTNQFNLTTKRYDENQINALLSNNALVNCVAIKDRFGDNGITVASIIIINGFIAEIDSFMLSCRILGRNIEIAYVEYLLNLLFDKGVRFVKAKYIPSKKNKQTEFFYEKLGFVVDSIEDTGVKSYKLELTKKREIKLYYKFKIIYDKSDHEKNYC